MEYTVLVEITKEEEGHVFVYVDGQYKGQANVADSFIRVLGYDPDEIERWPQKDFPIKRKITIK